MTRRTWLTALFCVVFITALAAAPGDITEAQKETVAAIREITLQLILIAVGVPALLAGFASAKDVVFSWKPVLIIGLILLALSVCAGLLAYGNLIYTLGAGQFDPFDSVVRTCATAQWVTFALGGLAVMMFIGRNIGRPGR